MGEQIRLSVYRRLDNRLEGLPDDSPRALELHNERRDALVEALDGPQDMRVLDWGQTKDTQSHELVELVVEVITSPAVTGVASAALGWLATRIKDAVSDVAVDGIKGLIQRLLPQQKRRRIRDFNIELPNGARVTVYPHDDHAEITVSTSPDSVTVNFAEIPDNEDGVRQGT
jgi:hypothetical protein